MDQIIDFVILLVASTVGTLGIALLFGVEFKKLPWGLLASIISCAAYEITFYFGGGYFLSAFVAAGLVAAYSDFFAHVLKTPATVLIILGIVPLVPGSMLYYTVLGAVNSDMVMFSAKGKGALLVAAGLALGIITVTAISRPINTWLGSLATKKEKTKH